MRRWRLRARARPQYTAGNDKNRTREVVAVVNRAFAILCGVVGVLSLAAPSASADDVEAKAQVCAQCHGATGVSIDPKTIPTIWGQQANYLYKQLHDFKSGDRTSAVMAPIVKDISLQDLRQIANYFAAKPWPGKPAASPTPPSDDVARKTTMCLPCHQSHFEGGAPAPRLAGLNYDYLAAAMKAYATGTRTNNGDMPGFMKALSDSDRDAIAKYLAGL
jgi:cytochrome c553